MEADLNPHQNNPHTEVEDALSEVSSDKPLASVGELDPLIGFGEEEPTNSRSHRRPNLLPVASSLLPRPKDVNFPLPLVTSAIHQQKTSNKLLLDRLLRDSRKCYS